MNNKINTILQIFCNRFLNQTPGIIEETREDMKRSIVQGKINDEDIAVFRLDQNGIDLFPFLKKSDDSGLKGMRRICDFVIFVSEADLVYALLIEMKKGKVSPVEQLDVTAPLIDFIFARARLLGYWDTEIVIRKIGISDVPDKRPTKDRGDVIYDDNNYVKLYQHKRLYLERLLH